tara:strand:- start:1366 stop:1569 length:204 start_codon:yes stop_codon:yes gene_type:complete
MIPKINLIKKIIKKNNSLNFYNDNFKTLIASRDREFHIFLHSFLAFGLSKKKGLVYMLFQKKQKVVY